MYKRKKQTEEATWNDKVYTPKAIVDYAVDKIDEKFGIGGVILDPCRGQNKVFYDKLVELCSEVPKNDKAKHIDSVEWCEIEEGKDFFKYTDKVDWIISNPPYSIIPKFLEHSFEIADNVVYVMPINKITSSYGRIKMIQKYGGVRYILIIPNKEWNFPYGFASGFVYIQKGYKGNIEIEIKE